MKFDELVNLVAEIIDLNSNNINEFRECIKGIEFKYENQKKSLEAKLSDPWYLDICPDDNKFAIYNEIAEIIDNYVIIGEALDEEKISKIKSNELIFKRLINKRSEEVLESERKILQDDKLRIYGPITGTSKERIARLLQIYEKNIK